MNYFDVTLDDDIDFLLKEAGKNIKINNKDARVVIQNVGGTKQKDDKIIITKFPVKQGMYANYNKQWFLVTSEIVDKRYDSYYKARISKCEHVFKIIIDNKLYGFPVVVESADMAIHDWKILIVRGDFIKIQMPKTPITQKIQNQQRIVKFGNVYEVWGKNEAKTDIIVATLLAALKNVNDDMENEIGGRYRDGVDLLDGNITPIMPFEEEEIPEEKAVVTFFVLDKETEEFISDVVVILEDMEGKIIRMLNGEPYEILKGDYTYTIEKEGYEEIADTITVEDTIHKVIFLEKQEEKPPTGEITYKITGKDELIWNQTGTYTAKKYIDDVEIECIFEFDLSGNVADIVGYTENTVDIKARSGIFFEYATLRATDIETGEFVEKEILIKSLV